MAAADSVRCGQNATGHLDEVLEMQVRSATMTPSKSRNRVRAYSQSTLRRVRSRVARLWTTFPGEIVGDEFAGWLERLAADPEVHTIIEIGSGAGDGSTRAFVAGANTRSDPPSIFCIETVESRAAELRKRFADKSYVTCYTAASASPDDYLSETVSLEYHAAVSGQRNNATAAQVVAARDFELEFLATAGIPTDALQRVRADHGIVDFDVALLDGSDFTGHCDLEQVYGATWLLLDDTTVMKNVANCIALVNDPTYSLVAADPNVRNGFAVFKKT